MTFPLPLNDDAPVFRALRAGDTQAVLQLLAEGLDPQSLDDDHNALMHYAVSVNNPSLVQALIDYPLSVDVRNRSGWYPIHFAAIKGSVEMVKLLVDIGGANPAVQLEEDGDDEDTDTLTPLWLSIHNGHLDIAQYLIPRLKGKLDALCDQSGATATTLAVDRDQLDLVRLLLAHGASPNGVNRYQHDNPDYPDSSDFIDFPLKFARNRAMVELLITSGAYVNAVSHWGMSYASSALRSMVKSLTPQILKQKSGQELFSAMQALLEHGASLEDGGQSPILTQAQCPEVQALLVKYAPPSPVGNPILAQSLCAMAHNCDSLGKLQAFNVALNEAQPQDLLYTDANNATALHKMIYSVSSAKAVGKDKAPSSDYVTTVERLLEKGADPNAVETLFGGNALHTAITFIGWPAKKWRQPVQDMVRLLLAHGADPLHKNEYGLNSYSQLYLFGDAETLTLLPRQEQDPIDYTAVMLRLLEELKRHDNQWERPRAKADHDDMIRRLTAELQAQRLDLARRNKNGCNLLMLATALQSAQAVALLQRQAG